MANLLDEVNGPVNNQGLDINVIHKQLPVTIGIESILFEIGICLVGFIPAAAVTFAKVEMETLVLIGLWCAGFLPPIIYWFAKISAKNYLNQLEQRIQAKASEIDNFLEQRGQILKNVVGLVNRAVELDKEVMETVAAFRGGSGNVSENNRQEIAGQLNRSFASLIPHVEAYPDLKAHAAIADAMRQNNYLQKEITAARTLYNDTVQLWNTEIFSWPTKQIVAARTGRTTRIPFSISSEAKEQARATFF